jgi:hypothetical protein
MPVTKLFNTNLNIFISIIGYIQDSLVDPDPEASKLYGNLRTRIQRTGQNFFLRCFFL